MYTPTYHCVPIWSILLHKSLACTSVLHHIEGHHNLLTSRCALRSLIQTLSQKSPQRKVQQTPQVFFWIISNNTKLWNMLGKHVSAWAQHAMSKQFWLFTQNLRKLAGFTFTFVDIQLVPKKVSEFWGWYWEIRFCTTFRHPGYIGPFGSIWATWDHRSWNLVRCFFLGHTVRFPLALWPVKKIRSRTSVSSSLHHHLPRSVS